MTDTARTLGYLLGTEFKDGQVNAISAQYVRDLVVTLQARTPVVTATEAEYGADPTGTADSTAAINAAITAATGGICFLPVGNYKLSATLLIPSNTSLIGSGYGTRLFTTAGSGFNFINNTNYFSTYNATTKTDQNIFVSGIRFDMGSLNDGPSKAVSFRMAKNCTVRDSWSSGGNNFTAMLACQTTLVENCHMATGATGFSNCAFDHWDGAQDMTVRKCSAVMVGGNGLLCTGVDTTGVLPRASGNGLFEDVEITGGGVGCYMNAGYSGCSVTNMTVRNCRFIGTVGGVAMDGPGGQHTIENIWWINGGSAGSGDCAVRISQGSAPTTAAPNDCFIDKIHIVNSTTAGANVGMIQLGGLRHHAGSVSCVGAAISGGTLFWFVTNGNGGVLSGPVFADAASASNISFGLYQDGSGAFGTNTAISCWDPFNGYFRHQGPAQEEHIDAIQVHNNNNLFFINQTNGAAAAAGTLTNAPTAGNPAFWVPITVNGTVRKFPVW